MKQATFYTIIVTNLFYVLGIYSAGNALYSVNMDASNIMSLSTFIDIVGHLLTSLLMLSCIIGSWILYERNELKSALAVALTPILLYLIVTILPHLVLEIS